MKNIVFNKMVDVMDKEYGVGLWKKYLFDVFGKVKK